MTAPVESQQKLSVWGLLRKIANPAIIAIVLAVALIFTGWKIPSILNTALVNTGSVTTALAMIYMGGLFCYTDIPMYFKKIEFYLETLVKMVIFPVAFFLVLRYIPGINREIAVTLCVLAALPTMTTVAMFAFDQQSEGACSVGMILVNTACSIVTLPTVCFLLEQL